MIDADEKIRNWLREQLDAKGYGARSKLARHLQVRPDVITRMLNEEPGKEARAIKADELVRMEEFFGAAAGDLDGEHEPSGDAIPSPAQLRPVVVAGTAAAGLWHEVDDADQSELEQIWEPSDSKYPNARLVAFRVAGDSMNNLKPRPILAGDRVIALSYEDVAHQVPLRDGMVVVIERVRDGGHTREWSVKQVEFYRDRVEFHPRSTNPRWKPIIVPHEMDPDNGVQVQVLGWVRRISNELD